MASQLITALMYSSISVMIMAILSVIAYMTSKIFQNKKWLALSKEELFQIGFSIILIFVIIGGSQIVFSLIGTMTDTPGGPFEGAARYLLRVQSEANDGLMVFFSAKYGINLMSAVSIPADPLTWMASNIPIVDMFLEIKASRPMVDMSTLDSAMQYLMFVIIWPMFASLMAQNVGLVLVKNLAMTFVLPMGLFLRVFPLSRNAGSFLIAIALAFYIVYPTTFLLHGMVYEELKETNDILIQESMEKALSDDRVEGEDAGLIWKVGKFGMDKLFAPLFIPLFSWISTLILAGIFLPTLSIIITITFIKTMQKVLSVGFK